MDITDILSIITSKLDNDVLQTMNKSSLQVAELGKNMHWWFRRVEQRVGRDLTWRQGDWARAYKAIDEHGLLFSPQQHYDSTLVTHILLELAASANQQLRETVLTSHNSESISLVVRDANTNLPGWNDYTILKIINTEDIESIRLFLAAKQYNHYVLSMALDKAVEMGSVEIVKFLLQNGAGFGMLSMDSLIDNCIESNQVDMIKFLLSQQEVVESTNFDYCLRNAVIHDRQEILELLVPLFNIELSSDYRNEYTDSWRNALLLACRSRSISMIKTLLEVKLDPFFADKEVLRVARRHNRQDVVELLRRASNVAYCSST